MYCKHCGKEIADDSTFCQYCGGKVDAIVKEPMSGNETIEKITQGEVSIDADKEQAQEVVITTKETQPIQVEVSQKSKDISSTIADEIVGNLKMVGIAFVFFVVYMIGFALIHLKDIKEYDFPTRSYFGESCYDPSVLMDHWKLNWEEHYYNQLFFNLYGDIPISFESPTPKQCLEDAEELEKRLKYNKEEIEYWKNQAKKRATRDRQERNDTINAYRKSGYEDDLKTNATYAVIICLVLCVLGRYVVKLTRWVDKNKTE